LNGDHILEPKLLWKIPQMGVLSTNFEVGTFFNNSKWSRLPFQANYFTKLMRLEIGKYGNLSNPK
jgi:hypothetical protein